MTKIEKLLPAGIVEATFLKTFVYATAKNNNSISAYLRYFSLPCLDLPPPDFSVWVIKGDLTTLYSLAIFAAHKSLYTKT